jgi:hypothetical protein
MLEGDGTGSISGKDLRCNESRCSGIYNTGVEITLTATANPGSNLPSWTGCDAETDTECRVIVNGDLTVTATFLKAARIFRSTSAIYFGGITVGTPAVKPLKIRNAGSADLTISSIDVTGTNAAAAAFTLNPQSCPILHKAEVCEIAVTFTPHTQGLLTARIAIASDDPNPKRSVVKVRLKGRGI